MRSSGWKTARSSVLGLALAAALAACTQTAGGGCPPLVTYSAEFQRAAAAELRALPRGARLAVMIVDYGKLRDACRR